MSAHSRQLTYLLAASLSIWLAGCSQQPRPVSIPEWSPPEFAEAILKKLDKNGNSMVDSSELVEAPGLAFGARFIDTDHNGQLSREELVDRFSMYHQMRAGLTNRQFLVTYHGRPLVGAEVRMVPDFFLTDLVEIATGTTDDTGIVQPTVPSEELTGMRVGYYRVEVTSPHVQLPAKFNTASSIGIEVSPKEDDPSTSGTMEIQLDKK